jgi:hypothetical protein
MDKAILKAAILSAISEELDLWIAKEGTIKDGYQYEEELMRTSQKINCILLSKSLRTVSCNRNKKNFIPVLERLK